MSTTKNKSFVFLGRGSLGIHFAKYFSNSGLTNVENVSFREFKNKPQAYLRNWKEKKSLIYLCTRDRDSIDFCENYSEGFDSLVCFSATVDHPKIKRFHPLMTFPKNCEYSLEQMKKIPFVGPHTQAEFKEWFWELENEFYSLPANKMLEYHARAFMACGIGGLLWKGFKDFVQESQIPEKVIWPILEQSMWNLKNLENPLTGPLERNEWSQFEKYIQVLEASSGVGPRESSRRAVLGLLKGLVQYGN